MPREWTYIMIKPDGVQRGLVGEIIKRFEKKGFSLVAMKMASPSKEMLETHYEDLKEKKFFPSLIEYMLSGPVVCMVYEGDNAVKTGRVMLGETVPSDSKCGSIRGDLCIDVGRNICHGSDSVESANKEIALWFGADFFQYTSHSEAWVYEKTQKKAPIFLGMGNPLLDISSPVPQTELDKWGVKAGDIILANEDGRHAPMYTDLVKNFKVEYIAGGATQNTLRVAAALLGDSENTAYIGCVGKDDFGTKLREACLAAKVTPLYLEDDTAPTGTCAVLIDDKERALIANLAAANKYTPEKHFTLPVVKAAIGSAKFFYCSGFFLTVSPPAMMTVATHASKSGKTFGLNLAAPFLTDVPPFKKAMLDLMPVTDYVFGNEVEALNFAKNCDVADKTCEGVAKHISGMPKANGTVRTCIITQGSDCTLVSVGGADVMKFPVEKLDASLIIDTNGAGDSFVGGFYSRLIQGAQLPQCVAAGHSAAALCIQQSGCKLPADAAAIVAKKA